MNIERTSFGGLLVRTALGNYAVNAGGALTAMEKEYRIAEEPLRGIILSCEHLHRSVNLAEFANRHGIPVLIKTIACAALPMHLDHALRARATYPVDFEGLSVSFHFVRYDSLDPVYLILRDGRETLGIVPDGRLTPKTVEPLLECRTVFLEKVREELPDSDIESPEEMLIRALFHSGEDGKKKTGTPPRRLRQRWKSFTNTAAEIAEMFPGYSTIRMGSSMICRKE